jgi:magnesium and cobalt transporter
LATDPPPALLALLWEGFFTIPALAWPLVAVGGVLSVLAGLAAWAALGGRLLRALQRQEGRRTMAGAVLMAGLGALLLYAGVDALIGSPVHYFEMAETRENAVVPVVILFARLVVLGTALWPPLLCMALGILWGGTQPRLARGPGALMRLGAFLGHGFAFWWPRPRRDNGSAGDEGMPEEPEPEFELTDAHGAQMSVAAQERAYIENILELGETTARDVMRPRPDVVAIDVEWPPQRVLDTVAGSRHSRFPVFESSIDNIVGVLHLRDLLEFFARGESVERLKLREILMEAMFVPESKKVDDILRALQHHKNHLAVVLDEYGGTAGILTIEDLLEEIVGEIQDEYDDEARLYHQREDGGWVVDAQLPLGELNDLLDTQLAPEDVDTLGGLVLHGLGHIPAEQEQVWIGAGGQPVAPDEEDPEHAAVLRLTVLSIDRNRIGQVLVERV